MLKPYHRVVPWTLTECDGMATGATPPLPAVVAQFHMMFLWIEFVGEIFRTIVGLTPNFRVTEA